MSVEPQNRAEVFRQDASPLSYASRRDDAEMIAVVRDALEQRRLKLALQPIVVASSYERIAFYEGLIRVLDLDGFAINASDFIYLIENTELGREVDCAALTLGLDTLSRNPQMRLSINLSARSIGYPKWVRILQAALTNAPRIGERLILEITEGSAVLVPDIVLGFMKEWNRYGITFAMDDFGAGYTSVRYFTDFSFEIVKIDGCFIKHIAHNKDNQIITAALLAIAKQFDLLSVAENVESLEDAAFLRELGVDMLQGYVFGAPKIEA